MAIHGSFERLAPPAVFSHFPAKKQQRPAVDSMGL
jgi:hypothetical protein